MKGPFLHKLSFKAALIHGSKIRSYHLPNQDMCWKHCIPILFQLYSVKKRYLNYSCCHVNFTKPSIGEIHFVKGKAAFKNDLDTHMQISQADPCYPFGSEVKLKHAIKLGHLH